MEIKRHLEKEEELIRKRLSDLTRTTSDESAEESDHDEESKDTRKDKNIPSPQTSKNFSFSIRQQYNFYLIDTEIMEHATNSPQHGW